MGLDCKIYECPNPKCKTWQCSDRRRHCKSLECTESNPYFVPQEHKRQNLQEPVALPRPVEVEFKQPEQLEPGWDCPECTYRNTDVKRRKCILCHKGTNPFTTAPESDDRGVMEYVMWDAPPLEEA